MEQDARLLELTADIVAAHLANNIVAVGEVAGLVQRVHEALAKLGSGERQKDAQAEAAVSIRASIKNDHLVCLVCGSRQKTLRRHIDVAHGLAPLDYRRRFNLPFSYPLVARDYADRRREIALAAGLGRNRKGVRKGAKASAGAAGDAAGGGGMEKAPKPSRRRPQRG